MFITNSLQKSFKIRRTSDKQRSKFHLRHVRQKNLSISKPFVKPTKLSFEQLVIIVSLSISCFHFCSFVRPTQLTEGSKQTFTLCQKAPAKSVNSIIYMTRITPKARNSLKSGTKVFLHVENNIDKEFIIPLVKGTEVIFSFCTLSNDPDLLPTVEFNPKTC